MNVTQTSHQQQPAGTAAPEDLQKLLVTACTHARRDMQAIIPLVESAAGVSASSLRNTLGLINKALVAAETVNGRTE